MQSERNPHAPRLDRNRIKNLFTRATELLNSPRRPSAQWQVFDPIHEIFRFRAFRDQFEVLDAAANGDAELVRLNQPGERPAAALAQRRFREKVFVPAEHHAPQFARAVEQICVVEPGRAVRLGGENTNATGEQRPRDGAGTWTSM